MKRVFLGIISILLAYACSETCKDGNSIHIIKIEEAIKNVTDVKLSSYASKINYFPLETKDTVILGDILYFFTGPDCIYITGEPFQRTIHLFTKEGKYLRDIGRKGRGPGEYSAVRSIITMDNRNAIMVEGGFKAVMYSQLDGVAIKDFFLNRLLKKGDIPLEIPGMKVSGIAQQIIWRILYLNDLFYISTTDNKEMTENILVVSIDSLNMQVREVIDFPRTPYSRGGWTNSSQIYKWDGAINVFHGYKDTVYKLINSQLVPRLAIDYGDFKTWKNSDEPSELMDFSNSPGIKFFEADDVILSTFFIPPGYKNIYPKEGYGNSLFGHHYETCIVYDKSTCRSSVPKYYPEYGMAGLYNDLDNGIPFWPSFADEERLYQFIDAGKFIELSKLSNSPEMKKVAASLTEESNPVMVTVTLK